MTELRHSRVSESKNSEPLSQRQPQQNTELPKLSFLSRIMNFILVTVLFKINAVEK